MAIPHFHRKVNEQDALLYGSASPFQDTEEVQIYPPLYEFTEVTPQEPVTSVGSFASQDTELTFEPHVVGERLGPILVKLQFTWTGYYTQGGVVGGAPATHRATFWNNGGHAGFRNDPTKLMMRHVQFLNHASVWETIQMDFEHYDEELCVRNERSDPQEMRGRYSSYTEVPDLNASQTQTLWFWLPSQYAKRMASYIPIDELKFHDFKIRFRFNKFDDDVWFSNTVNVAGVDYEMEAPSVGNTTIALADMRLYCMYFHLTTPERIHFHAQSKVQHVRSLQTLLNKSYGTVGVPVTTISEELPFRYPVSALYVQLLPGAAPVGAQNTFDYPWSSEDVSNITSIELICDGEQRWKATPPEVFQMLGAWRHMSMPESDIVEVPFDVNSGLRNANGTLNFSEFRQVLLNITFTAATYGTLNVWAKTHNTLTYDSGKGFELTLK